MNAVVKVIQTEEQQKQATRRAELEAELAKMGKNPNIKFQVVLFKHKKTGQDQVGINVFGVTTKPIFLYGSQALALVSVSEDLKQFVEENRSTLSWKS